MKKYWFIVFLFAIIQLKAQVPGYVSTYGLIGWWSFTGNAMDGSGNGHNGTVYRALPAEDRAKQPNSAYSFSDDSILVSGPDAFSQLTTVTVSAWMKTSNTTPMYQTVFSNYTQNATIDKGYWLGTEGTHADFWVGDGANSKNIVGQTIVTDGQWHLITGIYDGKKGYIYVDGKLDDSIATTFSTVVSKVVIGNDEYDESFTGTLDDIGVWRRVLSDKEITNLLTSDGSGIRGADHQVTCSVFPNPTSGVAIVSFSEEQTNTRIQLYDAEGRIIQEEYFSGSTFTIDCNRLSPGIYFLQTTGNGVSAARRKLLVL